MSDLPDLTPAQLRCRVAWTELLKKNAPAIVGATIDLNAASVTLQLAGGAGGIVTLTFGSEFVGLIATDPADMVRFDAADPQSYKPLAKVLRDQYGLTYRP